VEVPTAGNQTAQMARYTPFDLELVTVNGL